MAADEADRGGRVIQEWADRYGSGRLRQALEEDELPRRLYLEERAAYELPGFEVDFERSFQLEAVDDPDQVSVEALGSVEEAIEISGIAHDALNLVRRTTKQGDRSPRGSRTELRRAMSWIGKNVLRVSMVAWLVLGLACCGGGTAQSSVRSTASRVDRTPSPSPPPARERSASQVPASGGCGGAVVRRGRSAGAIDFQLKCRPRAQAKRVGFGIGLSPLPNKKAPRIQGYRRHPVAREPGSGLRRASCALYGGGLSCGAQARSLIVISGRLWVKKGTECDSLVVITEALPAPPCHGSCSGDAPARVIAQVRPRGC